MRKDLIIPGYADNRSVDSYGAHGGSGAYQNNTMPTQTYGERGSDGYF